MDFARKSIERGGSSGKGRSDRVETPVEILIDIFKGAIKILFRGIETLSCNSHVFRATEENISGVARNI